MTSATSAGQQPHTRATVVEDRLRSYGIVPVVELRDAHQGEELFAALSDGGLPVAEITLRTSAAETSRAAHRASPQRAARGWYGAKSGAGTQDGGNRSFFRRFSRHRPGDH
jgi:2-keto-3-deoxy-6-phosphogluconate aldolase